MVDDPDLLQSAVTLDCPIADIGRHVHALTSDL